MNVHVSPKYAFRFFLFVSAALVTVHVLGQTVRLGFGHAQLHGLIPLFDLEEEGNIPSYWSSMLWFSAASIAFVIAHHARLRGRRDRLHWSGLCAIFFLFSMDEAVQFHERLGGAVDALLRIEGLRPSGLLFYAWTIPAALFALLVFAAYFRFLLALPRDIATRMVLAGGVFLTGAVGFELLEGPIDEAGGYKNLLYTIFVTCEEALEMAGVCLLILALLRYIATISPAFEVTIDDSVPSGATRT